MFRMIDLRSSDSMENFIHELFSDAHACTHFHACNPPGPHNSHTHTCFHAHTKLVPAPTDAHTNNSENGDSLEKQPRKRPLGNREAVRKYREKKKARCASLEDEVFRLKAVNQHLLKRLRAQAALEAEVARLRCLVVDIRARIQGEIGSFPYVKKSEILLDLQGLGGSDFEGINNFSFSCFRTLYGESASNCKLTPLVLDKGKAKIC